MKVAVLFPGQGSQYVGMGQAFMESSETCKEIIDQTNEVCGINIGKLCKDGPLEELTRAINLQPAITAVNLMCYSMLKSEIADRMPVSIYAGHSLGEYSALHAAGVISVTDTIKLVTKRGALIHREGEKKPGGMRAILGVNIDQVRAFISECSDDSVVSAANHNTEQQIVISGCFKGLDQVSEKAEAVGAKVIALNVSVANHSPLVADAVPEFAEFMEDIQFKKPEVPVIFNVSAKPEDHIVKIKEMMARQIAAPVLWFDTINSMLEEGVDTFIEVGPKPVLKGMMRKIIPRSKRVSTYQFDTPDGLRDCLKKLF